MLGMQWYNGLPLKREQVTEQRRKDRKASGMTMNPALRTLPSVEIENFALGTVRGPG